MKALYAILCFAYKSVLRDLVLKAIDDPDSEVDDLILEILDRLFDYKE